MLTVGYKTLKGFQNEALPIIALYKIEARDSWASAGDTNTWKHFTTPTIFFVSAQTIIKHRGSVFTKLSLDKTLSTSNAHAHTRTLSRDTLHCFGIQYPLSSIIFFSLIFSWSLSVSPPNTHTYLFAVSHAEDILKLVWIYVSFLFFVKCWQHIQELSWNMFDHNLAPSMHDLQHTLHLGLLGYKALITNVKRLLLLLLVFGW